ncbi:enoyl-CoA hydratase [Salinisphaera dokdonensis CL-ES53]|uniref:Enoyl-CoA hydratase n=1 Tax=Salinisphaera dokdonensis CL-ES53 TaxID=1304272 RepID=A0ABV2B4F2_9GAMM
MSVTTERRDAVFIVTIDRPEARNAVDRPTADALAAAFREFEADDTLGVAILTGTGGYFCAGADLKAVASGERRNRIDLEGDAPMGPSRMRLSKPVIAAVAGAAVAGGLELACWCDIRVMERSAVFGVFCRRWGVPLIDGGTVRLPRLIGASRAMDMILTGRAVGAEEALAWGLANRVVDDGTALEAALELAEQIAGFPQDCMRHDRASAIEQWSLDHDAALDNEFRHGLESIDQAAGGADRFVRGAGRGGRFD